MPKGPTIRFDVPPTKWFVDRNLHHVQDFELHFSLRNGRGELSISDLVLNKQGQLKTDVFGEKAKFKRDIEENLSDAFCVLITTVLYRMGMDAWFTPRPCKITIRPSPQGSLSTKPNR
jgi:hypothetical protein